MSAVSEDRRRKNHDTHHHINGHCGRVYHFKLLGFVIIPALRRLKFGQSIREEGPKTHQKKAGTPTMGGLIFIVSIIIFRRLPFHTYMTC